MATLKTLEAQFGTTSVFNTAVFTSLLRALDARFTAYTDLTAALEAKEKTLLQTGLARLNDVVGPIAEQLLEYTTLGFLVAQSSTSQVLKANTQPLFVIDDPTQRALFTPSPFVVIERSQDVGTYAIARTLGYNKDTGQLQVLIRGAYGDTTNAHTDWTISGSSGLSEVIRVLAEQMILDAAQTAADRVQTGQDRAQTTADRIQTALDRAAAATSANSSSNSAAAAAASAASADSQNRVSKLGDIMSGILTLMFANPYCVLKNTDGGVNNNADWRILHFGPDGRLYFQNTDKNGTGVNAFSFGRGGDLNAAGMGDVKGYVDRGIRSDFFQGLSRIAQLTAKKNISVETGRRYYTGNGGVANLSAADIGALVYLEADITQVNVPLAANYADGDYFTVYCRGTVTVSATPGDPYTFGFASHNAGSFVMRPGDRCKIIMGADAWDVVSYSTRHDKALMADRSLSFSDAELQQLLSNAGIAIPHGQCRLVADSGTQLTLQRLRGTKIFINGNYRTIPPGGVQVSNANLSPNTRYWVYAYWNGSAIVVIVSLSTPQYDANYGYKIANGNPAAVYLGTVMTNPSGQFQDTFAFRGVNTYYGKRPRAVRGASGTSSTSSQTSVELATSQRAYFLADDETVGMFASIQGNAGSGASSPGYSIYTQPSLDGADTAATALSGTPAYGDTTATTLDYFEPSDGWHYLAIKGQTVGNYTASFRGCVGGLVWM